MTDSLPRRSSLRSFSVKHTGTFPTKICSSSAFGNFTSRPKRCKCGWKDLQQVEPQIHQQPGNKEDPSVSPVDVIQIHMCGFYFSCTLQDTRKKKIREFTVLRCRRARGHWTASLRPLILSTLLLSFLKLLPISRAAHHR